MTYFEIAKKIKNEKAIIDQIFFDKKYIRLTKAFENEGIEIVKDNKGNNFAINVELIK
jgi:hypothetical protein